MVIDDFRADFCKFHVLLRLLDKYPYVVEVKGGSRQWLAEEIFITAPMHPRDAYAHRSDEDIKQLLRRITTITHFTDNPFNPINLS